jgi:hypothetical protein
VYIFESQTAIMASTSQIEALPQLVDHTELQDFTCSGKNRSTDGGTGQTFEEPDLESPVSPDTEIAPGELWNSPRINIWRTCATFTSFLVMGANDAAYGVSSRFDMCD